MSLERRHVTVNIVDPGFIHTDLTAEMAEKRVKAIAEHTSIPRLGEVEVISSLFIKFKTVITNSYIIYINNYIYIYNILFFLVVFF